jgi:hypothetical protein
MSDGPKFTGQVRMPYPFKYLLAHVASGSVEAFFVSKTLADKAANDFNHTIGEGRVIYAVRKIFPDE